MLSPDELRQRQEAAKAAVKEADRERRAQERQEKAVRMEQDRQALREERLWTGERDSVGSKLLSTSTGCLRDRVPTLWGLSLIAVARGCDPDSPPSYVCSHHGTALANSDANSDSLCTQSLCEQFREYRGCYGHTRIPAIGR